MNMTSLQSVSNWRKSFPLLVYSSPSSAFCNISHLPLLVAYHQYTWMPFVFKPSLYSFFASSSSRPSHIYFSNASISHTSIWKLITSTFPWHTAVLLTPAIICLLGWCNQIQQFVSVIVAGFYNLTVNLSRRISLISTKNQNIYTGILISPNSSNLLI